MSKGTSLKHASLKQLEHEISKRKSTKLEELKREQNIIEEKIKNLVGNIESVVETYITPAKKNVKIKKSMHKARATNEKSLKDYLVEIASDGKSHTTKEFLTILETKGWKSVSAKPYYVVAAALTAHEKKNIFRRVDKGLYELVKAN